MESSVCSTWVYLCMVIIMFRNISADPDPPASYTVHPQQISFEHAMKVCSPGVLTTLSTQQEVSEVLQHVSNKLLNLNQNKFTFWVGLRSLKNECVVPSLPLRGFKWIQDGSQKSEVIHWREEPKHTCTSLRCAALQGEFDGTTVTRWGLIPVTCRNSYQFICKLTPGDRETPVKPAKQQPEPATPEPPGPSTEQPPVPVTHTHQSTPVIHMPDPDSERSAPPETNLKPNTGPDLQGLKPGADPVSGKNTCVRPKDPNDTPGIRSFILDPENSNRIQVECWLSDLVELRCLGHPLVWRLLDDSPVNFSAVCHPCESGFKRDALGHCVDIDECSTTATCRHTCLNSQGSFSCVCSDEDGKHHDEDSLACRDTSADSQNGLLSGILFPVLIAIAAFVVLLVVVAVTVKCCMTRRSKKHDMEKMAMKSKEDKDSFQTANEKTAT
ncbi:C-type lectin domain family 14 member A [Labrus bergylta]|uniref:C-type lectin domain family 14 member A n=1 Tax=Labrus bergylta TaxID=56723 RepID=UPI0009B4AE0B|nr:complement component C1q receptor-like [Labrus bergylta]